VIRYVGDFQTAEDAVQDAFTAALATWPRDGVPASPRAWLMTAARRRAVDRVRRDRAAARRPPSWRPIPLRPCRPDDDHEDTMISDAVRRPTTSCG